MDLFPPCDDAAMNAREIIRPQYYDRSFCFYNTQTNRIEPDIWTHLKRGMWRDFNIDAYLDNERQYASLVEHKDQIRNQLMFPHYAIIEPGHTWNHEKQDTEIEYTPIALKEGCSRDTLMIAVEEYFSRFEGERLGVHLSGGLDSSIIMAWLRELGIPFVAIGFKSNRWEFRTERRVQEAMAEYASHAELIDIDEHPFYSHIEGCPKCQTPYGVAFKDFDISRAIVGRFKELGVTTVFSGQGGDSLFVKPVRKGFPLSLAIGDEFEVSGENDLYYAPAGMRLLVPYSDMNIIQQIASLRIGEQEDVSKWWARSYFRDILPRELSQYRYVADMFGLSQSGLEMAKPNTKRLFDEANELTGNRNFTPAETERFLECNVFEMEFKSYVDYCARLSVAAWLHALFRNDEKNVI